MHYKIGDIAKEISIKENNPSTSRYDRFVGLEHFTSGEIEIKNYGTTKNITSAMKVFEDGDILIARRNVYLKRASVVHFDGLTSGDSIVLRAMDRRIGSVLPFILNTDAFWDFADQYAAGTMSKRLSPDILMKYEFDLPEGDRLDSLSDLLWNTIYTRNAYQNLLKQADELVKARFVELFGDLNINDKNWNIQPLGELCTIVRGGSPRPIEDFLGGDVPWIKISDATDGENIYLNSTKEHIIQAGVKKSRLVKSGSLIFANCGVSLGFARIITFDGCIHDGWLALENIDSRLDKVFLLQALNQMTSHFRSIAPAGTQPNLNTSIMKAYRQIIPPVELQREYVDFVAQVDKVKFAVHQSIDSV